MCVYEFGYWVFFDPALWSAYRSTPIWFSVKDPEWDQVLKAVLASVREIAVLLA